MNSIRILSEAPLTIAVDGSVVSTLTYIYNQGTNTYDCKYIVANGSNVPIQYRYDFDPSVLPPPA